MKKLYIHNVCLSKEMIGGSMKFIANNYEEKDIMKFLREGTNLKQEDFGKTVGLSKMTIQGYERGIRNYTFKTFMKIAKNHGYIITIEKKK